MHSSIRLLALLLLASAVQAQELTLFEPLETQGDDKGGPLVNGPVLNQNGQPAYTLRSSVRIGDTISLTLVDRQGKQTRVSWKEGQRAPLPGAAGYAVEDIQQRSVILSQPGNDPCLAAPKQGVSCLNSSRAQLKMALAAPVPVSVPGQGNAQNGPNNAAAGPQNPFEAALQAQQRAQAQQGVPAPIPGQQAVFTNPFNGRTEAVGQQSAETQAAREARQRTRADRLNRTEQNRITDDQVPPGQRRITTPFGDRLVPAQ